MSAVYPSTLQTNYVEARRKRWPLAWRSSSWVEMFVLLQIVCQMVLLFGPASTPRALVRTSAFCISLGFLLFLPNKNKRREEHPSARAIELVLIILGVSFFHPTTNGWISGVAQIALYLAILAPVYWVTRLQIDQGALRRIFLILFIFYSMSAAVGVLQVYFPGRFQPNLSQVLNARPDIVGNLYIKLADGQRVLRPMGLTDTPGGAGIGGFYAVLFAMGFFLTARSLLARLASVGAMALGTMCLYLSQVRGNFVMCILCVAAFWSVLAWSGVWKRLSKLIFVQVLVIVTAFSWATLVGGDSVTKRLSTLISDSPETVYYANRGIFLRQTVEELLPEYPLGAGLARWGMMNYYFGDNSDPRRSGIWAEIQWTGWLLDGGIPLILAYLCAILIALHTSYKYLKKIPSHDMKIWGGLMFAYGLGALALTFSYTVFIGQLGLEFWLLNAAFYAAARNYFRQREIPSNS